MFKFNFDVKAESSEDTEAVKNDIFSKQENSEERESGTKDIDWYHSEIVQPLDNLISAMDFYELNAKEMEVGKIRTKRLARPMMKM